MGVTLCRRKSQPVYKHPLTPTPAPCYHRITQGEHDMQRTYENGATVKMEVLNPEEPCISLRELRFYVINDDQVISQFFDQFDAVEFAKSL